MTICPTCGYEHCSLCGIGHPAKQQDGLYCRVWRQGGYEHDDLPMFNSQWLEYLRVYGGSAAFSDKAPDSVG